MLARGFERELEERDTFLTPSARGEDDALRRQRLREHLGQQEALRHLERRLDALHGQVGLTAEEHEPADLRCQRREVRVGFLVREHLEGAVHALQSLLEPAGSHIDLGEAGFDACRSVPRVRRGEERDGALEAAPWSPRRVHRSVP